MVSTASSGNDVLEWEQARKLVFRQVEASTCSESIPLRDAHGRVLAQDIRADRDYPALRRSLRDGFAIFAGDTPGVLTVRGETRAGQQPAFPLIRGEALEIMTGAPVPDGADAVVMIEHITRTSQGHIKVEQQEPGKWINPRAAEATEGAVLVPCGTRLDAGHISTLAMCGCQSVPVIKRPQVAILPTGDELVEIGEIPQPHQIRNSNSHLLAALVTACGGRPEILPIARDTPEALHPLLEQGLEKDLLLISGGVSAGRYDLVKPTLRELGVTFHFERVRIQPGGPCAFGTRARTPVFGLPGNPGSTYVTFQIFSQAALAILGGETDPILPLLQAQFEKPFKHRLGLTRFLPACLGNDGCSITHIPWQGSSDVPALAKANAFLVAEHDRESWAVGDSIRVMRKL